MTRRRRVSGIPAALAQAGAAVLPFGSQVFDLGTSTVIYAPCRILVGVSCLLGWYR